MGMHGYLHQVSPEKLSKMLADPKLVMAELYPDDGEFDPECTVEKTWNAIQFMLQLLSQLGHFPADSPYLQEPATIGDPLAYGPAEYRTAEQVAEIAAALAEIDEDQLREAFQPDLMHEYNVYPDVWDRADEAEWNFEWIRQHFLLLAGYYEDAADRGNGMLEYLG